MRRRKAIAAAVDTDPPNYKVAVLAGVVRWSRAGTEAAGTRRLRCNPRKSLRFRTEPRVWPEIKAAFTRYAELVSSKIPVRQ